jgi:hypothetical protein
VKLNVGGSIFMTSRETLMRDSNSMLARLVSESELISDKVSQKLDLQKAPKFNSSNHFRMTKELF